jgi:cardiolipin synthase
MKKQMPYNTEPVRLKSRIFTISNMLTFSRLLLTPIIVVGMVNHQWTLVFFLFLCAALTDLLDGYLARLLDEQTVIGTWLDPVADKCFLLSCYITLAFTHFPALGMPLWFVIFAVLREILLVAGVLFLLVMGKKITISPTFTGKLTTFFHILLLIWLFFCYFFGWSPLKTYYITLLFLAGFALFSLTGYVKIGARYLQER